MVNQGKESSMEEILSSIKRIIAEDHGNGTNDYDADDAIDDGGDIIAKAARTASLTRNMAHDRSEAIAEDMDDEHDVLDLTETHEDEILELTEEVVPEKSSTQDVFGRNDPRRNEGKNNSKEDGESARLIDDRKLDSMRQSLSALVAMEKAGETPVKKQTGETSLEDMTRDLMRPMLREWLNENLPALVEELVAKEIKRISQK